MKNRVFHTAEGLRKFLVLLAVSCALVLLPGLNASAEEQTDQETSGEVQTDDTQQQEDPAQLDAVNAQQQESYVVTLRLKTFGGKISTKRIDVYSDGKVGKLPTPKRKGYHFVGWYTKKSGGEKVKRKTRVSSLPKNTLYAQYEAITYRIRFKKNSVLNEAPKAMICSYGKSYVLPGKDNGSIDHWNTRKDDSGLSLKPGAKIKDLTSRDEKTITLYAIAFSGENNIEKLTRFFVRNGYTKAAAAAVAGNLMWESGGGPSDIKLNAVEKSTGRGIGMVQWTDTPGSPRRTNFERFCASRGKRWPNQDLKVQIDFLMTELAGKYGQAWGFSYRMGYPAKYKMSLSKFKRCRNVDLATRAFCANFERPYARDAYLSTRVRYAKIALKYVKSTKKK